MRTQSFNKKNFCKTVNQEVTLTCIDDRVKTEPKVYSCDLFTTGQCTGDLSEFKNCEFYEKTQKALIL